MKYLPFSEISLNLRQNSKGSGYFIRIRTFLTDPDPRIHISELWNMDTDSDPESQLITDPSPDPDTQHWFSLLYPIAFFLALTVPSVITWAEVKVSAGILYFAKLCFLPTYSTLRGTCVVSWGAIWFNFPSSLKLSPHLNTNRLPYFCLPRTKFNTFTTC
jgi:hypothetical protein